MIPSCSSIMLICHLVTLKEVQFQAKVGDFGLARQGEDYCSQNSTFPVKWTAPETIMTKKFNTKVTVNHLKHFKSPDFNK